LIFAVAVAVDARSKDHLTRLTMDQPAPCFIYFRVILPYARAFLWGFVFSNKKKAFRGSKRFAMCLLASTRMGMECGSLTTVAASKFPFG